MASGHTVLTQKQICKRFRHRLQVLLDAFHDTVLLDTQDVHVVNFSDISRDFVNVIIMYNTPEGRSVKLEALGAIDRNYTLTLEFIWQAMRRAVQEAPNDPTGPFASLTLPTQNDLHELLPNLQV